ncbi:hypothetical protein FB565_005828 [Actinoplanes lutulentus]|uniref:Uncharacterized protein n=1 Tax=Actinoplanes lutulentus TaxID=1287878 RepID=A0A327Z808_9ACTN|nr:hypothetical protein [Actinoplanes lutulentus]MBB2946070.1 hypothetical protein [Actinoplanes lutulentus]RAK32760.1 hypothetical protein B0I29_11355 [Actinoplanes lutulentus]
MSFAPEQVEAPARDAVLFRSSPARSFATLFAALLIAYLLASPAVAWFARETGDPWWVIALQAIAVAAGAAGLYTVSARAALPTWVRVSEVGLELAAQDSDPILLEWQDVSAVVIRRVGLRTVLEVVPGDMDTVHPVQDAADGAPALTDTPRGQAFTADLSQVWPNPKALRRELEHWMLVKKNQPVRRF